MRLADGHAQQTDVVCVDDVDVEVICRIVWEHYCLAEKEDRCLTVGRLIVYIESQLIGL